MNIIIQGSFPGGKPHQSVIINDRQALSRHSVNNNFQSKALALQPFTSGGNPSIYKLDASRLILSGSGSPLPNEVLQKMENLFKTNLTDVRVHTNGRQAESIGALAFATGNNVYFAQGRYDPYTPHGQRLLAHELTHVVQQKTGRVQNPFGNGAVVVQNPGLEAEAERMGHLIQNGNIKTDNNNIHNRPAQFENNSILQCVQTRARAKKAEQQSSKISPLNIIPDNKKKRKRRGVNRYGRGDGTRWGVGAFSTSQGIPTRNATRRFTYKEKTGVNRIGKSQGCHFCGTKISGWPDGHWTPDHQPPLSLAGPLHNYRGYLLPHCKACSSKQGGVLSTTQQ